MSQDSNKTDEIEQILNEVNELRRELQAQDGTITTTSAHEMKDILNGGSASAESPATETDVDTLVASVLNSEAIQAEVPPVNTDDLMREFHEATKGIDADGLDEGGMESTLADLKEDVSVQSILDE